MVKNPPARDIRDVGSIPGSGKYPAGGWQPTPVFLPGKSHGERSLAGYSVGSQRIKHDLAHMHARVFKNIYLFHHAGS